MALDDNIAAVPSFFGGGGGPLTYDELKRRRAIAAALAGRGTPVKDLASGMTAFGEGVGSLIGNLQLRQMEAAQLQRDRAAESGATPPPRYVPPQQGGVPTAPAPPPPAWKADPNVQQPNWPQQPPPAVAPPPPAVGGPTAEGPAVDGAVPEIAMDAPAVPEVSAADSGALPDPGIMAQATDGSIGNQATAPTVSAELQPPADAPVEQAQARSLAPLPSLPGTAGDPQQGVIAAVRARREDIAPPVQQAALTQPETPAAAPAAAGGFVPLNDPANPMAAYKRGIRHIESRGAPGDTAYALRGALTKGDRAYGAYQIMGKNVGPWTKAALGRAYTPQEFLKDPVAQEKTFEHRFQQYVDRFGPERAARAWFGGEGAANRTKGSDMHGKYSLGSYGQTFARAAGLPAGDYAGYGGGPVATPAGPTFAAGSEPKDLRDDITTALMLQGGEQTPPTEPAAEAPAQPQESRGRIAAMMAGLPSRPGQGPATASLGGGPVGMPTPQQTVSPMNVGDDQAAGQPQAPQPQQAPPLGPQIAQMGGTPAASWFTPSVGPAPNVQSGIPRAPDLKPGQEPIPPPGQPELKHPGQGPQEPTPQDVSAYERNAINQSRSPYLSEAAREIWKARATEAAKQRELADSRRYDEYKNLRSVHDQQVKTYDERVYAEPKRIIDDLNARIAAQKGQGDIAKQPIDLEIAKTQLEEALYKQGIPRKQAAEMAGLQIQEAKKKLAAPETFTSQGAQYERYPGQPGYSLAPGSPPPTPSEAQGKGIVFVSRVTPDLEILEKGANGVALTDQKEHWKYTLNPSQDLANQLASPEYRTARTAMDNWGGAFLTQVSGAAVQAHEAARQLPAFVPRPGDTEQDLADKARRRRDYTEAVGQVSGPLAMAALHKSVKAENDQYEAARQTRINSEMAEFKNPQEGFTVEDRERGLKRTFKGGRWEDVP